MIPLGPFIPIALLVGIMIPKGAELMPENPALATYLTALSVTAGVIVLGSFIITRVWRRLL